MALISFIVDKSKSNNSKTMSNCEIVFGSEFEHEHKLQDIYQAHFVELEQCKNEKGVFMLNWMKP